MKKESKLIAGLTAIIALAILVFAIFSISSCSRSSSDSETTVKATPAPIRVVKENGSQDALTKSKIELRMSKFGTKISKIKAFEKKQKDTLDSPNEATSKDGYTYLMYNFDTNKIKPMFDVKPGSSSDGSMLTYVFYKKHLTEVRYQYGKSDPSSFAKLTSAITKKYGKETYSRDYSNNDRDLWWKTKKATLRALSSQSYISVYFIANN